MLLMLINKKTSLTSRTRIYSITRIKTSNYKTSCLRISRDLSLIIWSEMKMICLRKIRQQMALKI